ncbi:MAG: hypothetical protein HC830_10520, partial [Bacteroidetes bacterium]|nr:hypothetical protein [Bacteroidota bacterium]
LSALKTLEENNTTTLEPIAASCGAGAYNVSAVATHILKLETYNSPAYLPYLIESHQRNSFLNTSLSLYFNQPYADLIPSLFNGQTNLGSINSSLTDSISKLMTPDMLINFATGETFAPIRETLENNSVEPWTAKAKLLLVHGKADDVVPAFESENLYNKFRELGLSESQIQLVLLDGLDHSGGVVPWGIKTILWLESLK